MLPTIKKGDLIIYRPFRKDKDILLKGLIVIVKHPLKTGELIIKRISKISSSKIELLGDNEPISIDSRQFGQISQNQVKGIVENIFSK